MMNSKQKRVVFVAYKKSVVVIGLEHRIADNGYDTKILTEEEFSRLKDIRSAENIIVLYLPENIMDNALWQRELSQICSYTKETGCTFITIGEAGKRSEIMAKWPEIKNHKWVSRPVDPDEFSILIDEMAQTLGQGADGDGAQGAEKRRVLIVDDDPSYAGMVRSWIKDVYKTDVVTAGMNAITFLMKNPVDIILLDYEMPVVDGPQVLQMLKQEEATKDIPVVFLTGVSTKEGVQRVMELKPAGYILKSTTREDILLYLAKVLS